MKNKKNRNILIGAGLAVVVIITIIAIKAKQSQQVNITPPISEPTQTSVPDIPPSVFPAQGTIKYGGTKLGISVFFPTEVKSDTIKIETTPEITLKPKILADNPTRVILSPSEEWKANTTYKITVKKGVEALQGGEIMREDLIITYKVEKEDVKFEYNPLM